MQRGAHLNVFEDKSRCLTNTSISVALERLVDWITVRHVVLDLFVCSNEFGHQVQDIVQQMLWYADHAF